MLQLAQELLTVLHKRVRGTLGTVAGLAESMGAPAIAVGILQRLSGPADPPPTWSEPADDPWSMRRDPDPCCEAAVTDGRPCCEAATDDEPPTVEDSPPVVVETDQTEDAPLEAAAEAEPEPAVEAEAEPEPAVEAEAEPEPAVEAEPEPAVEAEPEPAVEPESVAPAVDEAEADVKDDDKPSRTAKRRELKGEKDVSDRVRPLKVDDAIRNSTYLARIVWALGVADLEEISPLRPAEIARMIMARSPVSLEPPNVARYIRRSKPTYIEVARKEGNSKFYVLNEKGKQLFRDKYVVE